MKKLLPFMLLLISVYSCKKDSSSNDRYLIASEAITEYYPGDSTLLEQVTFEYGSKNQLVSVSRNWGSRYYVENDTYDYDGNNNIIAVIYTEGPNTESYSTTYNGNVPVSTVYTASGTSTTVNYIVENSRIVDIQFPEDLESITYNGNNYFNFIYSNGGEYSYTYGTHKSQFSYTGFKYCLYGLNYVVNDNEILSIVKLNNGSQTNVENNTYTYNSQGYPEKEEVYNNNVLTEQVIFSYKAF